MKVGARRIARRYGVVDGRPRTTALVVDGREIPVAGQELTVTVDGRSWSDADLAASAVDHGPGRLAWALSGDHLDVRVTVEADDEAGVVRKRAEVRGRGRLSRLALDHWPGIAFTGFETTGDPVPYNAGPVGLGQPVFGPGFFAGVEHPVAVNLAGPGGTGATLALPVAVDLHETEAWTSPDAVTGAGGLEAFWDYLDTLRPNPPRLVALTNNWYHLGATGLMDEDKVRAEVVGFARVAARHGLALDFVCLDDGWDGDWDEASGLWGRMAPGRFPSGLATLGDHIGLWLSPFGGYAGRRLERLEWAGAHGLEIDGEARLLCAAGARYRAHLADVLTRWTEAAVGYWKLDGISFACADPGHGHPVGPGARTAQVESFRGLVDAIRAVRPDAVVAFTIGSHPSPWWLSTVDFVWRGGVDDTTAEHAGARLDRFDTYIDTCLQAYRPAALPVSAVVTFSVVEPPGGGYRGDDSGPGGWARHCWLAAGRGTLHHDLYLAPDSLSDGEWAVLAEALGWARQRAPVLARSRMVLGDPSADEIYGFAARRGGSATLCLRNPSREPQAVDGDWPALLGFPAGTPLALTVRYGPQLPAHGPLTLEPFGVAVLQAEAG
ncbi:MAG: hypothetical protein M3203_08150 [Actinomycetota bacterium]|nr:hypothetical protein [Actinomycetota bacterium]